MRRNKYIQKKRFVRIKVRDPSRENNYLGRSFDKNYNSLPGSLVPQDRLASP